MNQMVGFVSVQLRSSLRFYSIRSGSKPAMMKYPASLRSGKISDLTWLRLGSFAQRCASAEPKTEGGKEHCLQFSSPGQMQFLELQG